MDQREVIHRYYIMGEITLDKVLQVMNHLTMDGITKLKDSRMPLSGEQNLYKMMNRNDPLTSVNLNEKVELNQLKVLLKEQHLPFSFKETGEGTYLFFRVKDKELAKNALENVLKNIKQSPGKILITPNKMSFEEKVAYARNSPNYKGTMASKNHINVRGKSR